MNFARLFLILTLALLVLRVMYGKPLLELFTKHPWYRPCAWNRGGIRNLYKQLHSSTRDDLRYHNIGITKLRCKTCPEGMRKKDRNDLNSPCITGDTKKKHQNIYKARCHNRGMIWVPPRKLPSKDEIMEMHFSPKGSPKRIEYDNFVQRVHEGEFWPTCRLKKRDRIGR